jgi:hypothetical protein
VSYGGGIGGYVPEQVVSGEYAPVFEGGGRISPSLDICDVAGASNGGNLEYAPDAAVREENELCIICCPGP